MGSHSHGIVDPGLCGSRSEPQGGAGPAARADWEGRCYSQAVSALWGFPLSACQETVLGRVWLVTEGNGRDKEVFF